MILCPVCGFRNMDSNDRCFKCSALLKRDEKLFRESAVAVARASRRERLTRYLRSPVDRLVHRPWYQKLSEIPDDGVYRYPFTAGLLTMIPGMGHIYAGQRTRGIVFFLMSLVLAAIAIVSFRQAWSNVYLFAMVVGWFLLWADAVSVASRRNGDGWRVRKTLALACGAMMILGVSVTVLQYLGIGIVSLEKVGTNALHPELRNRDRLVFSSVPFWFREPRIGEVVMFDPPRFTAEKNADVYSINIRKYFQRVIGLPGDRVIKQGSVFTRNGLELRTNELPYLGEKLPDFDVVVPEGCYLIPVTGIPTDVLAGMMGAGSIGVVGEPGYVWPEWPGQCFVEDDVIYAKGIGIVGPPERRGWLD